jgi:hypothetical protein
VLARGRVVGTIGLAVGLTLFVLILSATLQ